MNRRSFLLGAATVPLGAASPAVPVLDTHIHLFDPKRPEGVPWPPKTDPVLYQQALPDRYSKIAVPLGIVGAIKIEASPWLEDNQWVLDVIAKSPLIVGMVGNLEPGKPDFRKHFDRFHKNPLFLGIRCGNLWGRNFAADLANPALFSDLKTLSEARLTLDIANLNPELLAAVQRVNDRLPELRIVIDHLPQMQEQTDLRDFASRKTVFVKLSEVYRRIEGNVPRQLNVYVRSLTRSIVLSEKIESCLAATGRIAIRGGLIPTYSGSARVFQG